MPYFLFIASKTPEESNPNKTEQKKNKAVLTTNSNEGKTLLSWVDNLLSAIPDYIEQTPGNISKGSEEISLENKVRELKTSVGSLKDDLYNLNQIKLSGDITELEEEEFKTKSKQYGDLVKE